MLQTVLAWLELPNLHPAIVHFPVALLTTAVLLDLACVVLRGWPWLDRAASALYLLGLAGAGGAYLSGRQAAAAMYGLPVGAQTTLGDHREGALLTLVAFGIVALLRLLVSWLGRRDKRIEVGFFRLVALLAAAGALTLLLRTAQLGGLLVFRHGVGVEGAVPAGTLTADEAADLRADGIDPP